MYDDAYQLKFECIIPVYANLHGSTEAQLIRRLERFIDLAIITASTAVPVPGVDYDRVVVRKVLDAKGNKEGVPYRI